MSINNKVYIVEADFGKGGRVFNETPPTDDKEAVIQNLLDGQYHGTPIRVIAVDPDMADVSADIAGELVRRAYHDGVDLLSEVRDFCSRHGGNAPAPILD